jgi:HK97 family phage major capsid protein
MPRAPRAPVYGQGSYGRVNDSQILRSWLRVGSPIESDDDRTILARAGFSSNNQAEFRAQTSAAGLGAEIIPTGFFAEVSRTLKAYSRFRDISKVLTTDSGQPLRLPKNDDTSNTGVIISPEVTDHTTQDLAFTEVTMNAFTYSSKVVKVSNELLNDSGVDLSSFLGQQLGERIGRAQAAHFVNGTGSGQPQGVVAGATTFAAASATAIALNDIVGLAQSIDPAYLADQGSVYWAMNPAILGALRKLQDTLGRPLLSSIQDGNDTLSLFGYPIVIVPEMDSTMASSKKTVLFGNFQNFLIRDVSTLQVLRTSDRYFEQYATAFLAVYRTDAKVMQSGAFRVLTH